MNTAALREMPSSLNDACRKLELSADEIERLQKQCAIYQGIADQTWEKEAENEKLRAALKLIAECTKEKAARETANNALGVTEQCGTSEGK